ncbi:MAG: hypothetical protein IJZ57_07340 [Clostridia bacterium]|nr:hypothetical protein [Clostridia bacterium]
MTEEELLLSQIKDKIAECEKNSMITSTDFLDLRKQGIAVSYLKRQRNVRWLLYGGYEDAERKVAVFLPFYIDDFFDFINENPDEEPFVTFRADKDNFSSLSHRDYLGALTGLGIKREKLGDIIVDDKGCFFFAKDSISSFIDRNFSSAGRGTITVKKVEEKPDFSKNINVREICCFVATPRLDAVVGGVYSLSRSKAVEHIERGLVFVNDEQILKPDFRLKAGDKLVLKGKGRALIKDDTSKSKKGRIALVVDLFI